MFYEICIEKEIRFQYNQKVGSDADIGEEKYAERFAC